MSAAEMLEYIEAEREFRKATEALLTYYNVPVTDIFMYRLMDEMFEHPMEDKVVVLQRVCAEFGFHIKTRKDKTRN